MRWLDGHEHVVSYLNVMDHWLFNLIDHVMHIYRNYLKTIDIKLIKVIYIIYLHEYPPLAKYIWSQLYLVIWD